MRPHAPGSAIKPSDRKACQDVAGKGACGPVVRRRAPQGVKLIPQTFRQIGRVIGVVLLKELLFVAHRLAQLTWLTDMGLDLPAFWRDRQINLG